MSARRRRLPAVSRSYQLILPALLTLALAGCGSSADSRTDATAATTAAAPSAAASASASAPASQGASASAEATPPEQTADPAPAPQSPSAPGTSGIDQSAVEKGDLSADQLDAVGLDKSVTVQGSASVQIGQLRAETLSAGPGEVGGAGIVVPVTVSNTSGSELSLSGLVVNVSYGPDRTPAEEITSASDVIPASLAPGETQSIERAFVIPADSRGQVRVEVDLGADYPTAVFDGPAPS